MTLLQGAYPQLGRQRLSLALTCSWSNAGSQVLLTANIASSTGGLRVRPHRLLDDSRQAVASVQSDVSRHWRFNAG